MNFQTKAHCSYKSEIAFLSSMTLIFGFCCLFFGYLILPIAAGFYAALLSVEKKESRVLSYIIPLIPLVVNIFINGFCSLEAIGYVLIGAIIFVGFDRKKSKSATAFLATLTLFLIMIISLLLFAFDNLGTFKLSALTEFYVKLYDSYKEKFISFLTSYTTVDDKGFVFYNFNAAEAVDMYNSFVFSLLPLSIIFAFLAVGVATKLLDSRVRRYNYDDERLIDWRFVTSPFIAYSYIVITAFASLSSTGIVGVSLSFVSSILMAVYFYIGVCVIFAFISSKRGNRFAVLTIFLIIAVFYSFAPQIISFIGVFVNNVMYKKSREADI